MQYRTGSWFAVCAGLALFAAGCGVPPQERAGWSEPEPALFTTGPYILVGDETTAYVALKASLISAPRVEWWLADADPSTAVEVEAEPDGDLWIAKLTDVPPHAKIRYRVVSQKGATQAYTFRLGVAAGQPLRFAAFGDTRNGHRVHRDLIEAMAREELDVVINTGDMVERGGIKAQWDRFFQIERPLLVKTPIIPAIGNHDMGARDYFGHYWLLDRWTNGRRYFYHDWGNVRFVAVDSGIECRDGCAQFGYIDRVLREAAKKDMFIVMMLHHPPYSSGWHGSNEQVQRPIAGLAKKHGVELVLTGHDHDYERTKPLDGTTYIVSGSAGAPIRPVTPRAFTAQARTEPHYVLVDVADKRMTLRAVNLDGDVFDTTVIEPNPPRPE